MTVPENDRSLEALLAEARRLGAASNVTVHPPQQLHQHVADCERLRDSIRERWTSGRRDEGFLAAVTFGHAVLDPHGTFPSSLVPCLQIDLAFSSVPDELTDEILRTIAAATRAPVLDDSLVGTKKAVGR
jgi:hypothetical protein